MKNLKSVIKITSFIFTLGLILTRFTNGWALIEYHTSAANLIGGNLVVLTEQKITDPDGLTDLASKICNGYKPANSSDSDACKKDLADCNSAILDPLKEVLYANCTSMCPMPVGDNPPPCTQLWTCQATKYNEVISDQNLTSLDLKKKIFADCFAPPTATATNAETGDVNQQAPQGTQGTTAAPAPASSGTEQKASGGSSCALMVGPEVAGSAIPSFLFALGLLPVILRRSRNQPSFEIGGLFFISHLLDAERCMP